MKCQRCDYEWTKKVENPVECPRCKGRLDVLSQRIRGPPIEKMEVKKPMTNRYGRIGAVVLTVVVIFGLWAVFGGAPAAPPMPSGTASITGTVGPGMVLGAGVPADNASGIENIYIVENARFENAAENWSDHTDNCLGIITASTNSIDIPYDNSFVIVVAVKAGSDNMAYVRIDNMNIALASYGAFGITDENAGDSSASHMALYSHDNSGIDSGDGYLRINAYWDNDGNGYVLKAGQTLELENIMLWAWG